MFAEVLVHTTNGNYKSLWQANDKKKCFREYSSIGLLKYTLEEDKYFSEVLLTSKNVLSKVGKDHVTFLVVKI